MKAVVAGAGIGGLTTALFLHAAGIEVEIFERADQVRELGVGINLLPHAVEQLAGLGLLPMLDAQGVRTRELIYANRLGQVVWQELRGIDAGHDFPQLSIHRGRLLGVIHEAALERLGSETIQTGWQVDGFRQTDNGVTVDIHDGHGARRTVAGDLLVGADGIHSTVRARLYPDEGAPIWNGVMLWRGCTPWPTWRDGRTMMIAGGNFAKFVFYPIEPSQAQSRLTNWAVMAGTGIAGSEPPRREDWSRRGVLAEVLPFVRERFRLDFTDPAAIISASEAFYEYSNCDRDPLPRWSFGRVTLLGDAAHPMYPVGSNGASQAVLDAHCLADCLAASNSIEDALAAYDAQRRPATAKIVLSNRVGGPEGVIDLVETRAPNGFDDIETIAPHAEREAVVRGYAQTAGFAPKGNG